MSRVEATELSEGAANLDLLIAEIGNGPHDWNEAETRFRIIDRLLIECFGWAESSFTLERPHAREYTDYELGEPACAIWEAKREGKQFEVPQKMSNAVIHNLASVMLCSTDCSEAVIQVNNYCLLRGVQLAVATNGHQIVAFRAEPNLSSKTKSKCMVFDSLDHLRLSFSRAWQTLSPQAVAQNALFNLLEKSGAPKPPEKLSAAIPNYPQFREPTDLQRSMSDIAELVLLSIEEQPELEQKFYEDCYCESGALGQHALISKQMLAARYASLFPDAEDAQKPQPVSAKGGKPQLTPAILAEAISNRPIALVGDVGVGKSSFLKHLMYVSAFNEFQHAIYVYVNLGRKGALSESLIDLVLDQIEESLLENYQIDVMKSDFVKSVYKKEIRRFEGTTWGDLKETDPGKFQEKLLEMLGEKQNRRADHLRLSIEYLSKEKRKQIIIALDNADQRNFSVQQEAFVIAQNLAADWRATVFVSVRPRTFFLSKRSGTLAAYPHRIFTIAPPRVDEVLERRLVFALGIAEGRIQLERLKAVSFRLGNIATLIRVLLGSIDRLDPVKIFLENITDGNVRDLIQFVARMFGNPNVDLHSSVRALADTSDYIVPLHDFWKVAIQGDYQYYDPEKALAANLFDVTTNDPREHFTLPLVLGLLSENSPQRSSEGFVNYRDIVDALQELGIRQIAVDAALRRANNKKLIETPERVTFEEDPGEFLGQMPQSFRINTIGSYHLKVWMATFNYLDAMCVDTPIFDESTNSDIRSKIRSLSLRDRYDRAVKFRDYLNKIWTSFGQVPSYFDWESFCRSSEESFQRVSFSISRRASV